MKQFSNISQVKNRESFIYSELLALAICDISFFNFLNEERNRYIMNDKVFENQFIYEFRKYNIEIENGVNVLFPICIENDWNFLKDVYNSAINIKKEIPSYNIIIVKKDNSLLIDDKLISGMSKSDMITITDLENVIGVTQKELYVNFDIIVNEFIIIMKQYMKPEYLNYLNYFLDIYSESNLNLSYENYKTFTIKGLGIKIDSLPKLCYNNLADFCKDVIGYEPAFRDYNLMIDVWKQFKHQTFNIETIVPTIKETDKREGFINMVNKLYGLKEESYYRIDSKNNLVHLPSKSEYTCGIIEEKYKVDSEKNFYISLICDNIEIRVCISIGLAPYEILISNKLIENIDYERFI